MSRKRHRLVPETFGLKRRRELGDVEADPLRGESVHVAVTRSLRPGSAREAVAEIVRLFPRVLFEDALPPIALRSQVYSLVPDRTVADRQLKALQEQGEIRIVQLGFDLDAQGIMFTEDYRTRVLKACDGRPYAAAVQKFLASVLPACGDLSFQQDQMTQTFGFRDPEITWSKLGCSLSEMLEVGGSQCLELGGSSNILLKDGRLSSAWSGRPSTGSYSFQSSWAGGHLPRCDSASPTTYMTSLGPSWWTVSPPLLEPSSACQRPEDSVHHCTPPQGGD
ncbi:inactive serine/threonine-protein kinase 19 isoform X1 [Bos taurus]|uniref:inactive serine/threonine-protein kinase 19 isoform X1 n=1 Tax=Bos taurus TaxID=9913 RepID=UPI0028CB5DA1|nr:inactive serine/threonine-protein kinase 19 isoform X1 [Bos taurus]